VRCLTPNNLREDSCNVSVRGAACPERSDDSDEESLLFWTSCAERYLASLQRTGSRQDFAASGGVPGISRIKQSRNEGPCDGEWFPVSGQVGTAVHTGTAAFSTSATGALAYWPGGFYEVPPFVCLDRAGKQLGVATKYAKLKMKFHGDLQLASRVCGVGAAEKG
jgi:hypothetical protein